MIVVRASYRNGKRDANLRVLAMTNLAEVVARYRELAKQLGEPVALQAFGLAPEETAKLFNALDEDYHISRFLSFSKQEGTEYVISGSVVTHVRIDGEIASLL